MYDEGSHIKLAIEDMSESENLSKQNERLSSALANNDYPLVADMAKAVLETIFKTIINDRISLDKLPSDMNPLYTKVREVLSLSDSEIIRDNFKNITNSIVHNIAEIRNRFGAASHGNDGRFNNPLTKTDAIFLHGLTNTLGSFLILRHRESVDPSIAARLIYADHPEFNDWIDEQYDPIFFPTGHTIPYSLMLSKADHFAYRELYIQFVSTSNIEDIEPNESQQIEDNGSHHPDQRKIDGTEKTHFLTNALFSGTTPRWPISTICDDVIAEVITQSFAEKYPDDKKYPLDFANNLSPLTYFISKLEITDWHIRESAIAQMRTGITMFLRQQRVPHDDSYSLAKDITQRLIHARSK